MKVLLRWIPAFLVMSGIFLASATSGATIQDVGLGNETVHIVGHLLMFFVLYISYFFATRNLLLSLVLAMAYGFFDEYHQKFIYLRSPSFFDIKTDTLGALAGLILCFALGKIFSHEKDNKLTS